MFAGSDKHRSLGDAPERMLATALDATWQYTATPPRAPRDYRRIRAAVQEALIEVCCGWWTPFVEAVTVATRLTLRLCCLSQTFCGPAKQGVMSYSVQVLSA